MERCERQWELARHADNHGAFHRDRKLALGVLARRQSYMRKARRLSFKRSRTHRTEAPGLDQGLAI